MFPSVIARSYIAFVFARSMIRFIRPTIPPPNNWLPYVREAYESRWFSNGGPLANRFEKALLDKYGTRDREAVLLANCTDGLTAALLALGIKGNVAVPALRFRQPRTPSRTRAVNQCCATFPSKPGNSIPTHCGGCCKEKESPR